MRQGRKFLLLGGQKLSKHRSVASDYLPIDAGNYIAIIHVVLHIFFAQISDLSLSNRPKQGTNRCAEFIRTRQSVRRRTRAVADFDAVAINIL